MARYVEGCGDGETVIHGGAVAFPGVIPLQAKMYSLNLALTKNAGFFTSRVRTLEDLLT